MRSTPTIRPAPYCCCASHGTIASRIRPAATSVRNPSAPRPVAMKIWPVPGFPSFWGTSKTTTPRFLAGSPASAIAPTPHCRPICSATSLVARSPMSARVTTAISPRVLSRTSVITPSMGRIDSESSTPAKSLTYPRGDGMAICASAMKTARCTWGSAAAAAEQLFEGLRVERLDDVLVELGVARAPAVFLTAVAAHGDQQGVLVARGAQPFRDLEAVHARHPQVDEDDLRVECFRALESYWARMRDGDFVSLEAQQSRERSRGIDVVVHDQYALRTAGLACRRGDGFGRGNVRQRQPHDELAARAGAVASCLDRAAVQLDETAHQREPNAQTALGAVERGVPLHEDIEHAREGVRGDAVAVIADADPDLLLPVIQRGVHPDVPTVGRELDGVVHQVPDGLLQAHGIGEHHDGRGGEFDDDLLLTRFDGGAQRIERARDQIVQLDPLAVQLDFSMAYAGDVEQVVDHPGDIAQLAIEHLMSPLACGRVDRAAAQHLHDIRDGSERIAQLVRQHRDEFILALVGGAQILFRALQRRDIECGAGVAGEFAGRAELR